MQKETMRRRQENSPPEYVLPLELHVLSTLKTDRVLFMNLMNSINVKQTNQPKSQF